MTGQGGPGPGQGRIVRVWRTCLRCAASAGHVRLCFAVCCCLLTASSVRRLLQGRGGCDHSVIKGWVGGYGRGCGCLGGVSGSLDCFSPTLCLLGLALGLHTCVGGGTHTPRHDLRLLPSRFDADYRAAPVAGCARASWGAGQRGRAAAPHPHPVCVWPALRAGFHGLRVERGGQGWQPWPALRFDVGCLHDDDRAVPPNQSRVLVLNPLDRCVAEARGATP